jgi:hypothetical protein
MPGRYRAVLLASTQSLPWSSVCATYVPVDVWTRAKPSVEVEKATLPISAKGTGAPEAAVIA